MLSDLRFAVRQVAKNPGFAIVAVLSLALGIGATTSVFTIINGALLQPAPYPRPAQLAFLTLEKLDGGVSNSGVSGVQYTEWQKQARSFAGMAAYDWTFNFLIHEDRNESLEGMLASASLFDVLGLKAQLGRTFTEAETSVQEHPVILIGDALWRRRFGADPDIVGKVINLSRQPPLTVVGVMPPGIRFLPSRRGAQEPNYNLHAPVDYWLPAVPPPTARNRHLNIVARLKPDITLPQARAEMTNLAAAQAQADPELTGMTAAVTPVDDVLSGEIRRIVRPLFGAVCLVLLVAGANVTGLLLVRGLGRRRELSVRAALGASRAGLLRLVLTESVLLAALGGVLGSALAFAATKLLLIAAPNSIPRLDQVGVDLRVLGFAVGVSLLAGLSTGVVAAWQILRPDLNAALKDGGKGAGAGTAHHRVLGALVAGEVALTLMLLIGAALMLQTMIRLARVNPGYDTDRILTMVVTTLGQNPRGFHEQALASVAAVPGVASAAFVWGLPLTGNNWMVPITLEGRAESTQVKDTVVVPLRAITPDYFRLMGITLRDGRLFTDRDQPETPRVAIINEELARRHFPGENPIGMQITITGGKPMEIVGVVGNLRNAALNGPIVAELYAPFFQGSAFSKHLVLRTGGDPLGLVAATRRELQRIDPGVVVEQIKTMEDIRDDSVAAQRFAMTLASAFSIVALLLAVVGVYGVMSHVVLQRSHEIGIRMAIGAQRHHVLRLILRQGLILAGCGIVLGLGGALALTGVLRSLLFEINPTDPATFAFIAVLLAVATLLACWLPARRATKIDPTVVLRSE